MFDVEFGNSHGFFSASRLSSNFYEPGQVFKKNSFSAKIKSASIRVSDFFESLDTGAKRILSFDVLSHALLFDMVSRYVVIATGKNRSAVINGRLVEHRCSNLYHQYIAGHVCVPVGENGWIDFEGTQEGMPKNMFEHVFYVRDEQHVQRGYRWIVHHRIVATSCAERLILRGCNPRFEGPAPAWINDSIPNWIRQRLFRIREERFPNFPLMVIGENTLPAGHRITLTTTLHYHD
jgi:hypothetical protein